MQPENPYQPQNPYQQSRDPYQPQQSQQARDPYQPQQPQAQNHYPAQLQAQPYAQSYVQVPSGPALRRKSRWPWIIAAIVGVLVLACVGGVVAFALAINNSPAKVASQHYYDAIKGRDYASAYSYIDPAISLTVGNQSQQISQSSFAQVAQAYDAQKGHVSDYSITSVSLNTAAGNGNTADITVKVTRNTTYDAHIQLKQEGNDWKIISFDTL